MPKGYREVETQTEIGRFDEPPVGLSTTKYRQVLNGCFYVLFGLYIAFTFCASISAQTGVRIPGLEDNALQMSSVFYVFIAVAHAYAIGLLCIVMFMNWLRRLPVSLMIIAPLSIIYFNRWFAISHFTELRPI